MNLFPEVKTPYYIYTPGYTHISSGVRALHLLCHALNEMGEKAYLVSSEGWEAFSANPHLNTPELTPAVATFYAVNNIDIIAVYPDKVQGNPLNAKKVVRYLLAPAGLYGGPKEFPESDMIWGYTTPIAKNSNTDRVLLIPTFDRKTYHTPFMARRAGTCFYSHKYDKIHGNALHKITAGSARLEGSPKAIADTLRASEVCYVYEMTEVIVNAQLCGCPVEIVKTDYFKGIPEDWDMPAWGVKNGPLLPNWERMVQADIDAIEFRLPAQLQSFIRETQHGKIN